MNRIRTIWEWIKAKFTKSEDYDRVTENDDIRATIDTAIYTYEFLDSLDLDGPAVLRYGMKRKLTKTKKECLELIGQSIGYLMPEPEEETEEEEED